VGQGLGFGNGPNMALWRLLGVLDIKGKVLRNIDHLGLQGGKDAMHVDGKMAIRAQYPLLSMTNSIGPLFDKVKKGLLGFPCYPHHRLGSVLPV